MFQIICCNSSPGVFNNHGQVGFKIGRVFLTDIHCYEAFICKLIGIADKVVKQLMDFGNISIYLFVINFYVGFQLIPFALCQARLTVFLFMADVFFPRPWWAPGLVVFGFYLLSFVAVVITGLLFQRVFPSQEAFVLELPPYRTPSLRTIVRRGWTQMLNFMVTTRSFIVVGAAAIWLLTNLPPGAVQGSGATLADGIGRLFQPLLAPIGMNPALTVSLFFGFIAKEILLGAMAVIYRTSETDLGGVIGNLITPLQALSFMTFVLLYTPCLGTVAAQLQESKSRRFALLSLGWSLLLAWLLALLVFQGGRLLGFG